MAPTLVSSFANKLIHPDTLSMKVDPVMDPVMDPPVTKCNAMATKTFSTQGH